MSDRVACSGCGKWMFHLARTCPHCGTARTGTEKLELSSEEARALLAASTPSSEPKMRDVAAELVLPRGGMVELVLSLIALPVTALTLAVLGYAVLQTMRKRLPINLRGARLLAVPTSTALGAVLLLQNDVDLWVWVALGSSLGAWFVRDVLRATSRRELI